MAWLAARWARPGRGSAGVRVDVPGPADPVVEDRVAEDLVAEDLGEDIPEAIEVAGTQAVAEAIANASRRPQCSCAGAASQTRRQFPPP